MPDAAPTLRARSCYTDLYNRVVDNPYRYGSPVTGARFAGRSAELAALTSRMAQGINVVVTGPRRYGKTSLILEAVERLERRSPKAAVVQVNLMRCPTLAAFAERLVGGAHEAAGLRLRRGVRAVPEVLSRLRIQPTVTFDHDGRASFAFAPALAERDALAVLGDVYGVLASVSGERPAVLVLDEFQAVGDLGGGIAPGLKALADEHAGVSLVAAGSREHLMEALVVSRGAPLYGMAERIALGAVEPGAMVRHLEEQAKAAGKTMAGGVAGRMVERAGPVPNDIQRLAYQAFEQASRTITGTDVDAAIGTIVQLEEADFVDRLAAVNRGQRAVLVGIARAGSLEQPYASAFARQVGYAGPPGVRRAVQSLLDAELAVHRDGALMVMDPFFAEWLRRL